MRRHLLAAAVSVLLAPLVVAAPSLAQEATPPVVDNFRAELDAGQTVPAGGDDGARGVAHLTLDPDGTSLTVSIVTYGLTDLQQGHLHLGAAGEAGPVVAPLLQFEELSPDAGGLTADGLVGETTLTDVDVLAVDGFDGTLEALLGAMRDGEVYVNLHTAEHQSGAIRGQVRDLADEVLVNGTFRDDDFRLLEGSVEVLAAARVTLGCFETDFCPQLPLRRGQIAQLLTNTLHLDTDVDDAFPDDQGALFEASINAVAAVGITAGCTPDAYCASRTITRGQFAQLLANALRLPASDLDAFADDDGGIFEPAIDAVAAAGITDGCSATEFCPTDVLTRDQAAALVVRATGLTPIDVANVASEAGLVVYVPGSFDGDALVDGVRSRIEAAGPLDLALELDHVANAASVGLELGGTATTFVFGNPALGTPLLQASQTVALDLPQKLVVAGPVADQFEVDWNDPAYVAARHGITGQEDRLELIDTALLGLAGAADDPASVFRLPGRVDAGAGIVTITSDDDFATTLDAVRGRIEAAGPVTLAAEVDHAAAAASVDLELRPTTLLLLGNPALGTPLLQASRPVAIDLPQKLLVWEDAQGEVHVSWNDPFFVAERHDIVGETATLETIGGALRTFAGG